MNERVKAILFTAFKLSPEERLELAQALMDTLAADPAEAEQQLTADESVSGGAAEEPPQQPTSDVLAKYLDV
jgi:F0F1-type ATP synthase delta subunit